MRKILTILFTLLSSITFISYSQNYKVIDQVIWVVGDEPILYSDVENEIQRRKYEKTPIEGDPYCTIPEQIAIQKLFIAGAKLDSLTVSDASVEQQVDGRIKYFIGQIGSKEKVEEYFNKSISKIKEEMSNTIRDQLLMQQMQQHIVSNVRISPQDVKRFYDKMPKDSIPNIPEMVEVQIIGLYPEITAAEEERIKMNNLTAAIYMTSQGIPFIHAKYGFQKDLESEYSIDDISELLDLLKIFEFDINT